MGKPASHRSDRTAFLSVSKAAALTEAIKKEERSFYKLLQRQVELGRIVLPDEEAVEAAELAAAPPPQPQPDPEQIALLLDTAGQAAEEEDPQGKRKDRLRGISRSIWSVANPGYMEHSGTFQSVAQADYAWQETEVEVMRSQGELSDKHHRKRDGFTVYAEALLRNAHLQRRGAT